MIKIDLEWTWEPERNKEKDKDEIKSFMNWTMDIEDFGGVMDRALEWLGDMDYLNKKGETFAFKFWKEFVWDGEDEVAEEYYYGRGLK